MSIRTERVARLMQREIAGILANEFSEQLHPMVTVTGTRVTKDLSIVYVYVSIMGPTAAEREAAFKHLHSLSPQIRTSLAKRIRHQVRKIPELRFFLDESLEEQQKMDALFDRIRKERSRRVSDEDVAGEA